MVIAEYPLTLLAGESDSNKEAHRLLTEYLRTPDVQRTIAERTHRRPAVPGVATGLPSDSLVELPFPAQADVVDALLTSYFDKLRRPSRTIYVLDTSGSMQGDERIGALRRSLAGPAGADPSLTAQFRRFRGREEVTLLPVDDAPRTPQVFTVAEDDQGPDRQRIADAAASLQPGGATAIYDSLELAFRLAGQQIAVDPDRFTSIVLMTEGANTTGNDFDAFRAFTASRPPELRGVPVFCVLFVLFGESDATEMEEVAQLTGGRTFDARAAPLAEVFQEIRGYV